MASSCHRLPSMTSASSRTVRKGARHESLKAWISCHELVLAVYRVSSTWPSAERYGSISQARRAAYQLRPILLKDQRSEVSAHFGGIWTSYSVQFRNSPTYCDWPRI